MTSTTTTSATTDIKVDMEKGIGSSDPQVRVTRDGLHRMVEQAEKDAVKPSLKIKVSSHDIGARPGTELQQIRSKVLKVGMRVTHESRGFGEILEEEGGGVRVIRFDSGDTHKYGPESLHKIKPLISAADVHDSMPVVAYACGLPEREP